MIQPKIVSDHFKLNHHLLTISTKSTQRSKNSTSITTKSPKVSIHHKPISLLTKA